VRHTGPANKCTLSATFVPPAACGRRRRDRERTLIGWPKTGTTVPVVLFGISNLRGENGYCSSRFGGRIDWPSDSFHALLALAACSHPGAIGGAVPPALDTAKLRPERGVGMDQIKTVSLNYWATWRAPCREEFPEVEKLYESLKARKDVAVITPNIDGNPDLVKRFLYTFPVILASECVFRTPGVLAIPVNWVADNAGVVRTELTNRIFTGLRNGADAGEGEGAIDDTLSFVLAGCHEHLLRCRRGSRQAGAAIVVDADSASARRQ